MIGLVFLLLWFAGCSQEQPVAKLAPEYIKKSQFDGIWITNATTVAKQSHSSFAFTGLSCPSERVKFEITKDQLLAFKSQETGSMPYEKSKDQALVAAFTILDHKGSEYIKVDWSKNLAPHVECNGWLSQITAASVDNNETKDPLEPFRVRINEDYMENTVDAIVVPDHSTCEEVGDWLCHPAQYRVKYSFMKVKESDYEPWNYQDYETIRYGKNSDGVCVEGEVGCQHTKELWLFDGHRGEEVCDPLKHDINECYASSIGLNAKFGFFRTTKESYDRKVGYNRREVKNYINRYNLWEKSYESGELIPLNQRTPRKIVYYLNPGFPKNLHNAVKKIENNWNLAFLNVVAKVRDRCTVKNLSDYLVLNPHMKERLDSLGLKTIGSYNLSEACSLIYDWTKHQDADNVFFSGDPQQVEHVFGKILEIRVNDCNENNIADFIEENDLKDILAQNGISSVNDDNMEQACAVLELASESLPKKFSWQQPGDIRYSFINAITGRSTSLLGYGPVVLDPSTGEILSGTANIYLSAISEYATKSVLMMEEIDKIKEKIPESNKTTDDVDDFKDFVVNSVRSMSDQSYHMPKTNSFAQNLAISAKLNVFPGLGDWSKVLSEKGNGFENVLKAVAKVDESHKDRLEQFFSERSACFFQPLDNLPYSRLSKELQGLSQKEKIEAVKEMVFLATTMHELGHTFGLRHNFEAKSDALNYIPNFYGVNTNDFRMRHGLDKEEMRSSSVMDYHKRFNADFFGLGLYDYAALLMGYGQKVEVFDTREEDFVPADFVDNLKLMHYKDLPYLFSGNDANLKISSHFLKVKDEFLRGKKSAHMQLDSLGLKYKPENLYKRQTVDFLDLKRQKLASSLGLPNKNLVAVPYRFCTDGQARKTGMYCQPFIYGASASEIIDDQIRDYELGHLLRRVSGRENAGVNSYLRNLYGSVYAPILRSYQQMYAAAGSSKMIFPAVHDYAVSAQHGLQFISEVLQAVEPGQYCKNKLGNYEPKKSEDCEEAIEIDDVLGKRYKSTFDEGLVGAPKRIGYIYDKIMALLALIDDRAIVQDEFSSWRKNTYSIGFYRIFAPQLIGLFKNLYTDQWENFAPTITVDEQKKVHIHYRDLFKAASLEDRPKIVPSFSSSLKDYAILLSLTGLSNPIDHHLNLAKRAQITSSSSHNKTTDTDEVLFVDPNTGVRYRAFVNEDKNLSLGYQVLKDAYDFTCDGQLPDERKGPWTLAKEKVAQLEEDLEKVKAFSGDREKVVKLKDLLKAATKEFALRDRELREKVRVIEKVQVLSQKFTI